MMPASDPNPRSAITSGIGALSLEVNVRPASGVLNDRPILGVALANNSGSSLAVNRRLLLNAPGSPPEFGEIQVSLDGPPGYQNNVMYHVRAGLPRPEDFGVLHPGGRVEKSYDLMRYESLHLAGTYRLVVTYRNVVSANVDGLPAFTGTVQSPEVAFERQPGDPGTPRLIQEGS
jgi:hypothetical protein